MIRKSLLALLAVGAASPLAAQNGREYFVQPDTAYDSVHAVQRDAFLVLRDSTSAISAATSRLMAGLTPSTSLAWMRGRAGAVAMACASTAGPLARARTVTAAGEWPISHQQKAQADLLSAMTTFSAQLGACEQRWKEFAADTSAVHFRENAPYQLKRLNDQVAAFNNTAQKYLRYISIKLKPPST